MLSYSLWSGQGVIDAEDQEIANLASVVSPLRGPGPFALVDLGAERTEVTVLAQGEAVFVRTLSQGVSGLPATAGSLASELRQRCCPRR